MVNSPSRPNSRPPAPVECGGMTPLWNWETCLPVERPAMPLLCLAPPGVGTARPHLFPPEPEFREPSPGSLQSRQNQGKNPCNRASSRLIKASAKKLALESSPNHGDWKAKLPPPIPFESLRLCVFALKNQQSSHLKAPSRLHQGKNPSNQGSSCLIKANAKN